MKKIKLSQYFIFISVLTLIAIFVFMVSTSYNKLMGPIQQTKENVLLKPINSSLDLNTIKLIESRLDINTVTTPSASTSAF